MNQLFALGGSFSISLSNEYSGLVSFRIDWLNLLGVQESSPAPQFENINSSAVSLLYCPALTSVHDHWKTIVLIIWTFAGKCCLCFLINTLSRFVISFLPRSKRLLISWLQSLSTVILEPRKIKAVTFHLLFAMK